MEESVDTTIRYSSLKSGTYEYNYELGSDFFSAYENEKLTNGKVHFHVKMEKNERFMMFHFSFSGKVETVCDRCLGELEIPVEGQATLCAKISDSEESDSEEVVVLPEKESKIDLAQWLYEYVAVAIPIRCVHADDAEGNPTCDPEMMKYLTPDDEEGWQKADGDENAEEEIDPRWAALKELKNKQ